jgi:hypothetical protein
MEGQLQVSERHRKLETGRGDKSKVAEFRSSSRPCAARQVIRGGWKEMGAPAWVFAPKSNLEI